MFIAMGLSFLFRSAEVLVSLQFYPLLVQAQNPATICTLLPQGLWGQRLLTVFSHPHPTVSKATMGNLGTGLGLQTEDALRARLQSWRSFPCAHERTDCSVTEP